MGSAARSGIARSSAARNPRRPLIRRFAAPSPRRRGEGHSTSRAPRPAKRGEGGRRPGEGQPGGNMKLVVAIIRPDRLSNVLEELFRAKIAGLTISRVQGHGGETERVETYRGTTVKMDLSEKVRLEIGVSDHFVTPTVEAILSSARTGSVGDGKVFVLPVEKVYRIRTG